MTIRIKLSLLITILLLAALGNAIFIFQMDSHGEKKLYSSNPEELMKMSDIAMYASKKKEVSHYTLFARSMLKRSTH